MNMVLLLLLWKVLWLRNVLLTPVCLDFQGDNQNDSWIFALAVLLNSTSMYNSMGTINQQAMDQLQYPLWPRTAPRSEVTCIHKPAAWLWILMNQAQKEKT